MDSIQLSTQSSHHLCQKHGIQWPVKNLYSWFEPNVGIATADASNTSIGNDSVILVQATAHNYFKQITTKDINDALNMIDNCLSCIADLFFHATRFLDSGSEVKSTVGAILYAVTAYDRDQKVTEEAIELERIQEVLDRALDDYQKSSSQRCLHSLIKYSNPAVIRYVMGKNSNWAECTQTEGCFPQQLAASQSNQEIRNLLSLYGKLKAIQQSNAEDEYRQKEHQLYIDSFCVHDPLQMYDYIQAKPLKTEFEAFMKSDQKVFLLMANAGCGKTMFLQQVEDQQFEKLSEDPKAPIPLRIELSGLENPKSNAVEEGLRNKGFTESEIEALRNKNILIILDGVDEARHEEKPLSQLTKLYLTNKLYLWKNAKVVFSVRIGGGSEGSIRYDQFYPYANDSRESIQSSKLQKAVICPFSNQLMRDYIAKYTEKAPDDWKEAYPDWIEEGGKKYFNEMKHIQKYEELTSLPFTLRVIAEVLPGIIQNDHMNDVTKTMLYEAYITRWIKREEMKLDKLPNEMEDRGLLAWTWDYCMELAVAMRTEGERGITKVVYRPQVGFGNKGSNNKWDVFFGNSPTPRTCLRAAPIRRTVIGSNWEFSFYHQRLLQFLYTKRASMEATQI